MDRKGPWAAAQGGTRRRYTDQSIGAESIHFRIQLSLFCRLEQPVQPFSGWWIAHSLHGGSVNLVHTGWMRKAPPPYGPARWTVFVVGMDSLGVAVQRITAE